MLIICFLRAIVYQYARPIHRYIMWRLKIAEGVSSNELYSTNKFVGRQTWEYDPHGGSPEERAEVEEARLSFYNNRYHVKPSGDLLWRMQVLINLLPTYLYVHIYGMIDQPEIIANSI